MNKLNELELALQIKNDFVVGYSEWPQEGYTVVEFPTLEELEDFKNEYAQYKYIDGSFVTDTTRVDMMAERDALNLFRNFRKRKFKAWDLLKSNVGVGLEEPLTQEEIDWYGSMLAFPSTITKDTTMDDYPTTPARVEAL